MVRKESGVGLEAAAANCAGAYRTWALRTGHSAMTWPGVSANDLGLGRANPVNGAFLLAPIHAPAVLAEAMERVEGFFVQGTGGPIQLWSIWPTPDLTGRGYARYEVPGMIREPATPAPAAPPELRIAPAREPGDLAAAGRLIDQAFRCEAPDPDRLVTRGLIGDDFEVFVGWVDDRPVATASAYVSDGFCGVYAVATTEDARGRGYGAALTWAATTFRADLPATLQASAMGYPVYRAMGYRDFATFWLWQGPRPSPRD